MCADFTFPQGVLIPNTLPPAMSMPPAFTAIPPEVLALGAIEAPLMMPQALVRDYVPPEWVARQNSLTQRTLCSSTYFTSLSAAIKKDIEEIKQQPRPPIEDLQDEDAYVDDVFTDEKHCFGLWRRTTQEEFKKKHPKWEVLLDLDMLSAQLQQPLLFRGIERCDDATRCLLTLSLGGSDHVRVFEYDLEAKKLVPDGFNLPPGLSSITWVDENTVYVSTNVIATDVGVHNHSVVIRKWQRGQDINTSQVVFAGNRTDLGAHIIFEDWDDTEHLLYVRQIDMYNSELFFVPDIAQPEHYHPVPIPKDAQVHGCFNGKLLFTIKHCTRIDGTPYASKSLLGLDLDSVTTSEPKFEFICHPGRFNVKQVLPLQHKIMLVVSGVASDKLFELTPGDPNWDITPIVYPAGGIIGVGRNRLEDDTYFVHYESFLQPVTLTRHHADGSREEFFKALGLFNPDDFQVQQFDATSFDGTPVPFTVVAPKNLPLDGSNKTILYGYGGYQSSMEAHYLGDMGKYWLAQGNVIVISHIRGGGELGPDWHEAAKVTERPTGHNDFIAIARDLIARKITSPECLSIKGHSNGGLLVGVAVTKAPELFAAAIANAGVFDMGNYTSYYNGLVGIAEFGDPAIAEHSEVLEGYSPLANVTPGVKYPAMLLTSAVNDDRVPPIHTMKMTDALQGTGSQAYCFMNTHGGHGGISSMQEAIFSRALMLSFLNTALRPTANLATRQAAWEGEILEGLAARDLPRVTPQQQAAASSDADSRSRVVEESQEQVSLFDAMAAQAPAI